MLPLALIVDDTLRPAVGWGAGVAAGAGAHGALTQRLAGGMRAAW